jgi:hypothetical protein
MSLYQDITALSKPYLGPAAEQFIAKQCRNYLKIEPELLSRRHLAELAKWVETAGTRFMAEAKSIELAAKIARA